MNSHLLCNLLKIACWWNDLTTNAWQGFSKKCSNLKHRYHVMFGHTTEEVVEIKLTASLALLDGHCIITT